MNRLVEIRSQESLCRERAVLDAERRVFWLAQAKEWEQRALDEIAYHFRECNRADPQAGSGPEAARAAKCSLAPSAAKYDAAKPA